MITRESRRATDYFAKYPAYKNTAVFITEMGVPGGPRVLDRPSMNEIRAMPKAFLANQATFALTDENQANEMAKRFFLSIASGVDRVCWNTVMDLLDAGKISPKPRQVVRGAEVASQGRSDNDFWDMDTRGLVKSDFSKRIGFTTFGLCSRLLTGSRYAGPVGARPEAVNAHRFQKNGQTIYTFWLDGQDRFEARADMFCPINSRQVDVIDIYTGSKTTRAVENGQFRFPLSEKPIIVIAN